MKQKLSKLKYPLTGIMLGVLVVTLIVLGGVFYYTDSSSPNVSAATNGSDNVTGWLNIIGDKNSDGSLEQTFGWVSLDSSNTELSSPDFGDYGLEFEKVTNAETNANGLITELELKAGEPQYAWSSTNNSHGSKVRGLGWINFDPSGDPPGAATPSDAGLRYVNSNPGGTAENSTSGGKLTGWVRACSVFQTGCSGATENTGQLGGFDGWIKIDGANYNPSRTFERFAGFAWGGPTIGWMEFGDSSELGNSDYNGFRFTNALGSKATQPEIDSLNVTGGTEEATLEWTLASGTQTSDIAYLRYETNIPAGPNAGDKITNVSAGQTTIPFSGLSSSLPINPDIVAVNKFGDTSAPVSGSATVEPPEPEAGSCTAFPKTAAKDGTVRVSATVTNVTSNTQLDNWRISSGLQTGDSVDSSGEQTTSNGNEVTHTFPITFTRTSPNKSTVGRREPVVKVDITNGPRAGNTITFNNCDIFTYLGERDVEEVQP